jgi:hypothetical protein
MCVLHGSFVASRCLMSNKKSWHEEVMGVVLIASELHAFVRDLHARSYTYTSPQDVHSSVLCFCFFIDVGG